MLKRVDVAVYNAFKRMTRTSRPARLLGVADNGVALAMDDNNKPLITADAQAAVDDFSAKISWPLGTPALGRPVTATLCLYATLRLTRAFPPMIGGASGRGGSRRGTEDRSVRVRSPALADLEGAIRGATGPGELITGSCAGSRAGSCMLLRW